MDQQVVIEPWQEQDAIGSFHEAMAEIKRRVDAGEPLPESGYFRRDPGKIINPQD